MARIRLRAGAAACTVILSAWTLNTSFAQTPMSSGSDPRLLPVPASAAASRANTSSVNNTAGRVTVDHIGEPAPRQLPANADGRSVEQAGYHWGFHSPPLHYKPHPIPAPAYLAPNAPSTTPGGYPYLNAPMYPVPRPDIPYQTGGAFITNQALDPHEMLYAHSYRSMYPPYYYEVVGGWKTLPWGVNQSEHWRLRGTVVTVKYRSSFKLTSGFFPHVLP